MEYAKGCTRVKQRFDPMCMTPCVFVMAKLDSFIRILWRPIEQVHPVLIGSKVSRFLIPGNSPLRAHVFFFYRLQSRKP